MSSNIFKNYQVNVGVPFQVRSHINFNTIKKVDEESVSEENEDEQACAYEDRARLEEEYRYQAELILKEARLEADKIMEEAIKKAEEFSINAYESARQLGYEEGANQAQKEHEGILNEAEFIREHARVEYQEVLESIESDVVCVILEVARKVIDVELTFNKDDLLFLVKQAFEKCASKEKVTLKVSADDYDFLVSNKNKLLSMVEGMGELDIKKDTSLKIGACVIETLFGSIDAGVQTKMNKISEAFNNLIGKE